eukprot:5531534-Prymnesium_polylepis.1
MSRRTLGIIRENCQTLGNPSPMQGTHARKTDMQACWGHLPPPVTRCPSRHPAQPPAPQSAARRTACAPPPAPWPACLWA